jgi:hypothetical protein
VLVGRARERVAQIQAERPSFSVGGERCGGVAVGKGRTKGGMLERRPGGCRLDGIDGQQLAAGSRYEVHGLSTDCFPRKGVSVRSHAHFRVVGWNALPKEAARGPW